MDAATTVGDAIKLWLSRPDNWGELWDDEEERAHAEKVEAFAELRWTLGQFLRSEYDDQKRILEDYLGDTFDERSMARWLDGMRDVAQSKPTKQKAGDKWTRPNRMVCNWNYGRLDLSAYAVLQTMVSHGDDQGGGMFISQRKVADILGWSTTEPVRRAQLRLQEAGALTKLEAGRHGKPTKWRMNTPPDNPLRP